MKIWSRSGSWCIWSVPSECRVSSTSNIWPDPTNALATLPEFSSLHTTWCKSPTLFSASIGPRINPSRIWELQTHQKIATSRYSDISERRLGKSWFCWTRMEFWWPSEVVWFAHAILSEYWSANKSQPDLWTSNQSKNRYIAIFRHFGPEIHRILIRRDKNFEPGDGLLTRRPWNSIRTL